MPDPRPEKTVYLPGQTFGDVAYAGARYDKDRIEVTHMQNIDPTLKRVKYMKNYSNKGWSKGREFKHEASVPMHDYLKYDLGDDDKMDWFLKTDYGSQFRISR